MPRLWSRARSVGRVQIELGLGPRVAGDPGGEPAEGGAREIQKQGDRVEGQGDCLPEPSEARRHGKVRAHRGHFFGHFWRETA